MRSTDSTELHLLVPGLLGPFVTQSANGLQSISDTRHQSAIKTLQRSLSRAAQTTLAVSDYYSTLHYLLCPQQSIKLSDVLSRFDQLPQGSGFYYLIEPVHFRAESDHAVLLGSELLQPQSEEAQQLVETFNAHFAVEGISLHAASASRWYLQSERELSLELRPIEESLGRDIKHFMPQGGDALWWRRILNEAQMLFFEHPVNLQREQQQQLSINGLWLFQHGFKAQADSMAATSQVDRVHADNEIALALCDVSDLDIQLEAERDKIVDKAGHSVLVDETFMPQPVMAIRRPGRMRWVNSVIHALRRWTKPCSMGSFPACIFIPVMGAYSVSVNGSVIISGNRLNPSRIFSHRLIPRLISGQSHRPVNRCNINLLNACKVIFPTNLNSRHCTRCYSGC